MPKHVLYFLVIFGCLGLSCRVMADSVPLSLGGWNQDLIAENTASSPIAGTSTSVLPPGGTGFGWPTNIGWAFYEAGAPNSSQGLPTTGEFVSAANAAVTFQLQDYTGNNAILNDGMLTLAHPASFASLSFLTSSQGASGQSFDATLQFSDGSTSLLTGDDPDWVTPPSPNTALANVGLVHDYNEWGGFYTATLDLFEHDYTLTAADQAKTLDSITFSRTSGNYEMLFAVSGTTATPLPSAMWGGMGLLACCGLIELRREWSRARLNRRINHGCTER